MPGINLDQCPESGAAEPTSGEAIEECMARHDENAGADREPVNAIDAPGQRQSRVAGRFGFPILNGNGSDNPGASFPGLEVEPPKTAGVPLNVGFLTFKRAYCAKIRSDRCFALQSLRG